MYDEIPWSNEYNLHLEEIDAQHKYLLALLNRLIKKSNGYLPEHSGEKLASDLIEYTRWHFHCEETLMQLYQYDGLRKHIEEHQQLLKDLISQVEKSQNDKQKLGELAYSLTAWFGGHAFGYDKEMAEFINRVRRQSNVAA